MLLFLIQLRVSMSHFSALHKERGRMSPLLLQTNCILYISSFCLLSSHVIPSSSTLNLAWHLLAVLLCSFLPCRPQIYIRRLTNGLSPFYRDRLKSWYVVWWNLFLLAKQGQEQISPNHVPRLLPISVQYSGLESSNQSAWAAYVYTLT